MNSVAAAPYRRAVRSTARRPEDEPGRIVLRRVIEAAWRRAGLGLVVGLALVVLVLAYAATLPRLYTAYGEVLVDPKQANLTAIQPVEPGRRLEANMLDTQVELLGSRAVADGLVRRYGLDRDPEFNPAIGKPNPNAYERVVRRVRSRIDLWRGDKSHMITVGFTSRSPRKAAMLANGVMQVFLEEQVKEKVARLERADDGLRTGLESMRRQAEAAEQQLAAFKNAHGLYGTDDQVVAEKELSLLDQQVATAQSDAAERRAALAAARQQAGGSLDDVGASTTSPAMRALRKKEAEVSIRLAQLRTDFTPQYPEVKRTQAQLNDVRAAIQQETRRVLSSLQADANAASGRAASLAASRGSIRSALAARDQAGPQLFSLERKVESAKEVYGAYLKRIEEIAAARDITQPEARIAVAAYPPRNPSAPEMLAIYVMAVVLGGLGAAAAIIVAELWNPTVRTATEIERRLGLSLAGLLPELASVAGPRRRAMGPAEYLVRQPLSSFAEAFRNLNAFLSLRGMATESKLVALTSAIPGEGKSLTCFCLGRAMALSGKRVVAIDCDLRRRGLTKQLGDVRRGVAQVVEGSTPRAEALVRDDASGLWVLPAGPGAAAEDLFARPEFDALLQQLREDFDQVLLDTPPLLGVADARIVATKADQVLLALRWDRTPLRTAQAAAHILRESGVAIAGAVLTRVDARRYAGFGGTEANPYHRAYHREFDDAPIAARA
jgi:uncharacterized protein involved in exopolysaccharide biosynthesis/Mrp family chromosome partitioning ATPase